MEDQHYPTLFRLPIPEQYTNYYVIHARVLFERGAEPHPTGENTSSPLLVAAMKSSPEMIQLLTDAGADIHRPDRRGGTVLHGAAAGENASTMQLYIVESGFDVNVQDRAGLAPLALAYTAPLSILRSLIKAGADVDIRDDKGITLLHYAERKFKIEVIDLLFDLRPAYAMKHFDVGTAFRYAILCDGTHITRALIRGGQLDVRAQDSNGNSSLHKACSKCALQNMDILLDAGSPLDMQNKQGMTQLMMVASSSGSAKGIELLLQRGANVHFVDEHGKTALYYALERGHAPAVKALLPCSIAGPTRLTHLRKALMRITMRLGRMTGECMKLLLEEDHFSIDHQDDAGKSASMEAASCLHTDAVRALLTFSPNLTLRDHNGRTALMLAATSKHCTPQMKEIFELIGEAAYTNVES